MVGVEGRVKERVYGRGEAGAKVLPSGKRRPKVERERTERNKKCEGEGKT